MFPKIDLLNVNKAQTDVRRLQIACIKLSEVLLQMEISNVGIVLSVLIYMFLTPTQEKTCHLSVCPLTHLYSFYLYVCM